MLQFPLVLVYFGCKETPQVLNISFFGVFLQGKQDGNEVIISLISYWFITLTGF